MHAGTALPSSAAPQSSSGIHSIDPNMELIETTLGLRTYATS